MVKPNKLSTFIFQLTPTRFRPSVPQTWEDEMAAGRDPNKSKIARRVIEVLEFFDDETRHATAMEIARRYGRPQSSTWELLSSLVELGLLYKDPGSRLFRPTPRAAMLGSAFQPRLVRDGRLSMLTDSLRAATGLSTAVMGLVGLDVQIFHWSGGARPLPAPSEGLCGGAHAPLHQSAAGWLLLGTIAPARREGMLRRLRAEAAECQRFNVAEIEARIQAGVSEKVAIGPAGFGAAAQMISTLLPVEAGERPMALGLVHEPDAQVDPSALTALLQRAVQACLEDERRNVVDLGEYRVRAEERARPAAGEWAGDLRSTS
jgi:DNA-binding IclR family transcriptional regulator